MPRIRSRVAPALPAALVALAAAFALGTPAAAVAATGACGGAEVALSAAGPSATRATLLCVVNDIRATAGRAPLATNQRLAVAAQRHAADMVARRFFAHVSPTGGTVDSRVDRAGYLRRADRWTLGENIGWAEPSGATPANLVGAWMNSPTHRAVILDRRFREAGIGITWGAPVDDALAGSSTFVLDVGIRR